MDLILGIDGTMHVKRSLRILILITGEPHRRNWIKSGLVDMLRARGHEVMVEGEGLSNLFGSRFRIWLRRGPLRTASYVTRARTSDTYRHKLRMRDAKRERLGIALWTVVDRVAGGFGSSAEAVALWLHRRLPADPFVRNYVSTLKPDVVVLPTLIYDGLDLEVAQVARRAKIKIIMQIATWDGLTCKGCFLVRPDRLLVWGEASKRHAMVEHGFTADQVVIVGAPQYDIAYGKL